MDVAINSIDPFICNEKENSAAFEYILGPGQCVTRFTSTISFNAHNHL